MILPLKAPFFVAGSYHLCSKRRAEMVSLEHATMASHKRKKSERHPGPGVDWNGTIIWYWNLWWLSPLFWETHTYIYIYIYIYIYTHNLVYVCVYIYIYIYICVNLFLFIFIHIHSYLFMFVHMCSYVFICVHIYSYLCIFIQIYSYLFIFCFIHIFPLIHALNTYTYKHDDMTRHKLRFVREVWCFLDVEGQ
jgi:hypothetical protein